MPACRDNVERGLQSETELEGKEAKTKTLTRAVIEQLKPIRTLLHTVFHGSGTTLNAFRGKVDLTTDLLDPLIYAPFCSHYQRKLFVRCCISSISTLH